MMDMQTIQARWCGAYAGKRKPKWVVLHSMEIENKPDSAENVGWYFHNMPDNTPNWKKASAHIGVDQNSAVRYVADNDIAYAAPGSNELGLHLELAEYARSTEGHWLEADGRAMLNIAAPIIREWCEKYNIPKRFVNADALRRGESGITTHYEVTKAWGLTDHTDPGSGFPISTFISQVTQSTPPQSVKEASALIQKPAVAILVRPQGDGYWIVASDGGVFSFGGAPFFGSMGGQPLQAPVLNAAVSPTGNGYILLGADGGVFCFGDMQFYGSAVEWIK